MICLFLILRNSSSKKSNSRNAKRRRQANLVQLQQFKNGKLAMRTVLERFCMHFNEIYDEKFIEKQDRKFFLFFLKPIINGTGNLYVEAEPRDERRMDVVIDYTGERFVVELKVWCGNSYNKSGEKQPIEKRTLQIVAVNSFVKSSYFSQYLFIEVLMDCQKSCSPRKRWEHFSHLIVKP